jgi:hypothetical protein
MSAVDEFLSMTKTAAPSLGWGQKFLNLFRAAPALGAEEAPKVAPKAIDALKGAVMLGGTAAVGGTVLGLGEQGVEAIHNAASRAIGFHTMMKDNPDLDKMDRKRVHTMYNTLHRFNPEMARDPYVAGGWMRRIAEYDVVDPKTISDLISARSKASRPSFMEMGLPLAQAGMAYSQFAAQPEMEAAKTRSKLQAQHGWEGENAAELVERAKEEAASKEFGKLRGTVDFAADDDYRRKLEDVTRREAYMKQLGQRRQEYAEYGLGSMPTNWDAATTLAARKAVTNAEAGLTLRQVYPDLPEPTSPSGRKP